MFGKMKKRKAEFSLLAFTLIELLVVIAIIAILAAIAVFPLVPALSRSMTVVSVIRRIIVNPLLGMRTRCSPRREN